MADLVIRGMEMPTNVYDCPLNTFGFCNLAHDSNHIYCIGDSRPEWCPLVPLPEGHGDLMDKAAFETDIKNRYCTGCDNYKWLKCKACWVDDMLGEVEDVPTIIEAEGGEADGN